MSPTLAARKRIGSLFASVQQVLLTHIHFNYLLTLWFVVCVGIVGYCVFVLIVWRGIDRMAIMQELNTYSGWNSQISEQSTALMFATESADRDVYRAGIATTLEEMGASQYLSPGSNTGRSADIDPQIRADLATLRQSAAAFVAVPAAEFASSQDELDAILMLSARLASALQEASSVVIVGSHQKLVALVYLATTLLVVVLGSLTVIYFAIVRPMVRNVRANAQQLALEASVRKQAEQQARQSEALYRLLVEHLPRSAVFLFDRNLRHSVTEGPMVEMMGYRRDRFLDKTPEEALPPDVARRLRGHYEKALNGETSEMEGSANGITFHAQYLPIRDESDTIVAGLALVRDITDEKQAARNQVELAIERERSKLLADFVRDISHDFRTPLSVLSTNLYLLRNESSVDRRERRGETMQRQIDRLSRMLDQLVVFSRLEIRSRMDMVPSDVALHLRMLHDRYLAQARDKGITLGLNIQPALPKINIDTEHLNRAFANLMENALQYVNQGGSILLEAYLAVEENMLVCAFEDTGAGIPDSDLAYVFDPFFRGDKARSTETGGAGLGLTIVKRVVALHGGSVCVFSTLGKGARFEVHLPLSTSDTAEFAPVVAEA